MSNAWFVQTSGTTCLCSAGHSREYRLGSNNWFDAAWMHCLCNAHVKSHGTVQGRAQEWYFQEELFDGYHMHIVFEDRSDWLIIDDHVYLRMYSAINIVGVVPVLLVTSIDAGIATCKRLPSVSLTFLDLIMYGAPKHLLLYRSWCFCQCRIASITRRWVFHVYQVVKGWTCTLWRSCDATSHAANSTPKISK